MGHPVECLVIPSQHLFSELSSWLPEEDIDAELGLHDEEVGRGDEAGHQFGVYVGEAVRVLGHVAQQVHAQPRHAALEDNSRLRLRSSHTIFHKTDKPNVSFYVFSKCVPLISTGLVSVIKAGKTTGGSGHSTIQTEMCDIFYNLYQSMTL